MISLGKIKFTKEHRGQSIDGLGIKEFWKGSFVKLGVVLTYCMRWPAFEKGAMPVCDINTPSPQPQLSYGFLQRVSLHYFSTTIFLSFHFLYFDLILTPHMPLPFFHFIHFTLRSPSYPADVTLFYHPTYVTLKLLIHK